MIGISVFAAAPVAVSQLTGMPVQCASAEAVVVGADKFTVVTNDDGTAVLTAFKGTETEIEIPQTVEVDGVSYTVTGIGDRAFSSKSLTSVVLPDTITSIGASAFANCSKLTSIIIPDSVTSIGTGAFTNCKLLAQVNIPAGVDEISASVFSGCGFTSIDIPNNVKSIGANAFANCASLVTVNTPDCTEEGAYINIVASAFNGCNNLQFAYFTFSENSGTASITGMIGRKDDVEVPSRIDGKNVRAIAASAFQNKTFIKSVVLPESIASLGKAAFSGCTSLSAINFPASVTAIPDNAFNNCGFTNITIPSTIKSIGANAFGNCKYLVTVNVPDSTERGSYITIASSAFNNCPQLDFSYFTYTTVAENNNASITGVIGQQANIILPQKINGYNVVTTGKEAFKGKKFIETVVVSEGVTSLGTGTFSGCTSLSEVTLPSTLTIISDNAFEGCTSLSTAPLTDPDPSDAYDIKIVEIGSSAFKGCTGLTSIPFSDTINKIGANAFEGCTGVTSITMPNNIRTLGNSVFRNCTGLSEVKLSESLRVIPLGAFSGCSALRDIVIPKDVYEISNGTEGFGAFQGAGLRSVTLPEGLQTIGGFAFSNCQSLEDIEMFDNVTTLGDSCFNNCISLSKLTLSKNLTKIPNKAFMLCFVLDNVKIPEKVTEIGNQAFTYCRALSELTIPKKLEKMGDNAFSQCGSLTIIELPDTITTIGAGALRDTGLLKVKLPANAKFVTLNKAVFSGCSALAEVIIPENVTSIGDAGNIVSDGTFYGCTSLEEIKLPSKLTKIGSGAFAKCNKLKTIVIPDLVTTLGDYSFYDCSKMTDVTFGKNVNKLGACAFEHCLGLKEFEIPSTVTTLGTGLFSACENLKKLTTNADLINNSASRAKSAYELLFYTDSKVCLEEFYGEQQGLVNHALEEVVFNHGVTTIGDYSFGGAPKLKRITIADTVTRIGIEAFYNCGELVFVNTIPKNVTEISDYAFSGCSNLKAIVIPKTVTTFGYKVFSGDTNLTIFGESGSAAETYAKNDNENVPFVNIYQQVKNTKAVVNDVTVSLTWDKISDTIVANGQQYKIDKIVYHIYRTGSDGVKTKIADVEGNSYTDRDVTAGSTYTYSINCSYCFITGNEEYTIDSSESTVCTVTVAKNTKPQNVKASAGDGQVTLTWDKVDGATGYAVYTYIDGKYTKVGSPRTNSFVATGLTNGTKYGFLVRAYVGGNWSMFTSADIVYATPASANVKPTNVKVAAADSRVVVAWDKLGGATNYIVYSYADGKYTKQCTTTSTSVTIRGLTNGKKYGFLVRAYVNGSWSTFSSADIVYATPASANVKPTNVKVAAADSRVVVAWDKLSGATNYIVYSYADGKYTKQCTTTSTSVNIKGLTNGKKYGFLVRAYVNGSWSTFTSSDVVYATPVSASVKPTNVKVAAADSRVVVAWDKLSGATNYIVYSYADGKYTKQCTTTSTSVNIKGLTNGKKYGFLVRAYVNGSWSAFTSADIVYATPNA